MRLIKFLGLGAVLFSAATAFGLGGMTSSGGDYKAMDWESAWFLGATPISYCIEIAPTEKLSLAQARNDFESVVKTWQHYRADRRRFQTAGQELNFNYKYETCASSTQLKIYVGVENEETKRGKSLYQNPYAFSYRSSYDRDAGLGQGFIWLAASGSLFPLAGQNGFPNWSAPSTFHGMLLHEMGHVYGCGHVDGTVMEADLVSKLQMADSNDFRSQAGGKMYMTNIDHHRFLLLNWDASLEMKGDMHIDRTGREGARIFELLTGRKSKGKIEARVQSRSGELILVYSDTVGTETFKVALSAANRSSFDLGGQVFLTVRGNTGESTGTSGYSYLTTLTSKQGKTYTALVTFNGQGLGRPIDIQIMEGGILTRVFYSDLWVTHGIN